ncbi:MAG: 30S ribosomal protein S16 [bacterium]
MAVALRFQRVGKPKKGFYRMVAIDVRKRRDGRPIEVIGHYDPSLQENKVTFKEERLNHWISKGAILSETVRSLIKKKKISDTLQ